jgi:hypothetical protein
VGERVGVRATTHALRRAFAVAFLTSHPGAIEALQALMNHSRIDTTQVYLRALNRSKAMEAVRNLSWGLRFQPEVQEAHTGFEPVLLADALTERLRQKLDELRGGSRAGKRGGA